ncbi:bifunctional phosphoribosyl-AMP cyclohydrolase/phosphoribosyl-ATP diphosphatase HisIE [Alkalicaulis satelles]|uniref:Histidine biosynthesis bifunctional protein HisIE n=1 Tax=Alkalicaulis satelles TaxID=2609175 RepID=A0A5M6ZM52_9PROT|nr:bifunctional phosphoribosyl-AMP cyclohydrolase/phosphoribosyl-ATP diphosphatase HisIE [Alkalicaulis satelles]KAA5804767.1 bifunctional phosphoribosyl-AMP cyclohydrolase/phosphoribosyl-ATP diphosphatase HisIE [Alkalicaulis satelles]
MSDALDNALDVDWEKGAGLVPAVIQDADTGAVLMLGYMNAAALDQTRESGLVTFWSRSKNRLWTKGETSGNVLRLVSVSLDCDRDTLLIQARPEGPVCHLGTPTCWGEETQGALGFLARLERIIADRQGADPETSYTARLFSQGVAKIAQKVGEEGVETALAAVGEGDDALTGEAADLIFHLMVLLRARGLGLGDVAKVLAQRHGG